MVAILRLVAVIIPFAATFVSAQNIPKCAQDCATQAAQNSTCTGGLTNFACICNSEAFFDAAGLCALKNCDASDVVAAQTALKALCAKYATTTFTLPASLTSTLSLASQTGNTTHQTTGNSTTSTGSSTSTSSSASQTKNPGAAAPGVKINFGTSVLAVILGGVVFGAYAVGL